MVPMAPTHTHAPLLLTGFDPFGGDAVNPSWLVARALHGQRIAGRTVVAAQLPTVFGAAQEQLQALLALHRPALVGLGASVLCLALFGAGNFILPAMALIVLLLLVMRPALDKKGAVR